MAENPQKENFIHRVLSKCPWLYALFLLFIILILCAAVFDKAVMPIVARERVEEVVVPQLEGLDSASAVSAADSAGFRILFAVNREYSDSYDVGLVMRQNPLPGKSSKPNRTIRATLSEGLHQFTVPDLFDKNGEEASVEIEKAGLNVGLTFETPHPNLSRGKVVRTNPSEGSLVHRGDTVDVFLSSGPRGKKGELPDVVGMRTALARGTLRTSGFIVGKVKTSKRRDMPTGTVISQEPSAGTPLPAGAKVNLIIVE